MSLQSTTNHTTYIHSVDNGTPFTKANIYIRLSVCLVIIYCCSFVIGLVWFGLVLWHINHCWLCYAKSILYIYIEYMIWMGWVLWHITNCSLSSAKSLYIYISHHVEQLAQISLVLSRHFSLSFIASERSSGLHPVSSYSCCMHVRACHPAFARSYAGVHRSTSLMSSSLLHR